MSSEMLEKSEPRRHRSQSQIWKREHLSFSWYCRRLLADTVADAAARTGEAIFGRAPVEITLPACAGTTAATLLNMAMGRMWCGGVCRMRQSMGFNGRCGMQRGCVGVGEVVTATRKKRLKLLKDGRTPRFANSPHDICVARAHNAESYLRAETSLRRRNHDTHAS